MANSFSNMTLEQLTDSLGVPGSMGSQAVMAELTRRQTQAQIDAARWMRRSVVALTVATILNIVVQIVIQVLN